MWERFTPHYTPTHESWLNIAELDVSLLSRQCLGNDRIPDRVALRRRVGCWNRRLNRETTKICWKFTSRDARRKFYYRPAKLKEPET